MAQTTTVRVHQHTRQAIAELSAQRGTTARRTCSRSSWRASATTSSSTP